MKLETKFCHYCIKCERYFTHLNCGVVGQEGFKHWDAKKSASEDRDICMAGCNHSSITYATNPYGLDDFEYFVLTTRENNRWFNKLKRFVSSVIPIH